ncbi:MAG: TonB-dependent receptor [Chitinophagaceae bacterium]|nr:TonB-dependent receptor [Chitinophagaceae bacterium]
MYRAYLFCCTILFTLPVFAQSIQGRVLDSASQKPVDGASVFFTSRSRVVTDTVGNFKISSDNILGKRLFIGRAGYQTDSITIKENTEYVIFLKPKGKLQDVTVSANKKFFFTDRAQVMKTEVITAHELTKAACCNLSESFGSSTTIDISNTDAVTGSKQLQMFGLDGTYVQIDVENIPGVRGLNIPYGLSYIPGTWISSVNIGKGAGSVVNGYESMTGQINVELQKPDVSDKLYYNAYINSMGKTENNIHLSQRFNKSWSTLLLLHASGLGRKMDKNNDGFRDVPLNTQYNFLNRWKYESKKRILNFGVQVVYNHRLGGTLDSAKVNKYVYESTIKRANVFAKIGHLYPRRPFKSVGIIINGSVHEQVSSFGYKNYSGQQQNLYGNLIYMNILGTTAHQYKMGASINIDHYKEKLGDHLPQGLPFDTALQRTELVSGGYFEYTNKSLENVTAIFGLRADYNSIYGLFYTPRFHLLYNIGKNTAIRVSAGKGRRTPNAIAENIGSLISSRRIVLEQSIKQEQSLAYGMSFTQSFHLAGRSGDFVADIYRTSFSDQLIVDRDADPYEIRFYNLNGKSYSNSVQLELSYKPFKRFDVHIGYKWNDVKATFHSGLKVQPFVNKQKGLLQFSYATNGNKWTFDFSGQWLGVQRLPGSTQYFQSVGLPSAAPAYVLLNLHVNRKIRPNLEIYAGTENFGNYMQKNPIIDYQSPNAKDFDASMVWGPLTGRMIYGGLRYKLN